MPQPPVLLALDTATDRCSVALAHGGALVQGARDAGQRHTEFILPMIDALLAECGLVLGDCDAIAFGAGPGSFTGLRVACGVAQGLAFGIDRPAIAVGNLDALAADAFEQSPGLERVCAATDARMREVYCAVFERDGDGVRAIAPPSLATPAQAVARAQSCAANAIVGNAVAAYAAEFGTFAGARVADVDGGARAIARLGLIALARGEGVAPASAAPLYVRDRVALTVDERRAGAVLAGQGGA